MSNTRSLKLVPRTSRAPRTGGDSGFSPSRAPADPLDAAERALQAARRRVAAGMPSRRYRETLRRAEERLIEAAADREDDLELRSSRYLERPGLRDELAGNVATLWQLADAIGRLRQQVAFAPRTLRTERLDAALATLAAVRRQETEALFEAYWVDLGAGG